MAIDNPWTKVVIPKGVVAPRPFVEDINLPQSVKHLGLKSFPKSYVDYLRIFGSSGWGENHLGALLPETTRKTRATFDIFIAEVWPNVIGDTTDDTHDLLCASCPFASDVDGNSLIWHLLDQDDYGELMIYFVSRDSRTFRICYSLQTLFVEYYLNRKFDVVLNDEYVQL